MNSTNATPEIKGVKENTTAPSCSKKSAKADGSDAFGKDLLSAVEAKSKSSQNSSKSAESTGLESPSEGDLPKADKAEDEKTLLTQIIEMLGAAGITAPGEASGKAQGTDIKSSLPLVSGIAISSENTVSTDTALATMAKNETFGTADIGQTGDIEPATAGGAISLPGFKPVAEEKSPVIQIIKKIAQPEPDTNETSKSGLVPSDLGIDGDYKDASIKIIIGESGAKESVKQDNAILINRLDQLKSNLKTEEAGLNPVSAEQSTSENSQNSGEGNLANNFKNGEYATKIEQTDNIEQSLTKIGIPNNTEFKTIIGKTEAQKTVRIAPEELPKALQNMINTSNGENPVTARLVLKPDSLGTVFVEINIRNNVAGINIRAENKDAIKQLEGQLYILKEKLQAQGIDAKTIELSWQGEKGTADGGQTQNGSAGAKEEDKSKREYLRSFRKYGDFAGNQTIEQDAPVVNSFIQRNLVEKYI